VRPVTPIPQYSKNRRWARREEGQQEKEEEAKHEFPGLLERSGGIDEKGERKDPQLVLITTEKIVAHHKVDKGGHCKADTK